LVNVFGAWKKVTAPCKAPLCSQKIRVKEDKEEEEEEKNKQTRRRKVRVASRYARKKKFTAETNGE